MDATAARDQPGIIIMHQGESLFFPADKLGVTMQGTPNLLHSLLRDILSVQSHQ